MNKITKQCVAAIASLAMAGTLCVAGAVVANNVAFATSTTQAAADADAPWNTANKDKKVPLRLPSTRMKPMNKVCRQRQLLLVVQSLRFTK